jgi:hypothetical protein
MDDDKNIRTLDIVTTEAGLVAMDEPRSTPDDRRWAREVLANAQARLAEMRRNLLPKTVPIKKAEPIRPDLIAMSRDALVALFTRLTEQWGPQVQYAHRDLDVMSDNDLRRLIQMIDHPV